MFDVCCMSAEFSAVITKVNGGKLSLVYLLYLLMVGKYFPVIVKANRKFDWLLLGMLKNEQTPMFEDLA